MLVEHRILKESPASFIARKYPLIASSAQSPVIYAQILFIASTAYDRNGIRKELFLSKCRLQLQPFAYSADLSFDSRH